LKFNPFANVSREEIEAIFARAKLPRHPLVASGFLSVGGMPCTSRTTEGEDERAGRWRGRAKTECGIHTLKTSEHRQAARPRTRKSGSVDLSAFRPELCLHVFADTDVIEVNGDGHDAPYRSARCRTARDRFVGKLGSRR
jgi:hypothetical protein